MITSKEQINQFLEEFEINPQNAYKIIKNDNERADLRPQLIPLTSRNSNGQYIPNTTKTYKNWRKLLFSSKNNYKKFAVLDYQGNTYTTTLPYIYCNTNVLLYILNNKWYLQMDTQALLIDEIIKNPKKFIAHIVQKKDKSKNSWLMLYVELK